MTYQYENLGDERFQQLAQAILTAVFPNVQCLPIGQPDGGRDAFFHVIPRKRKGRLIIFQVKYSRNPQSKGERGAIQDLIKSEKDKVVELIKRGATEYYLITNVSGTSHLDAGSIDIVNKELSEAFGIPAYCWWRDDLDRRIDGNADVKWSYSDILRGSDILQWLIEGVWKDDPTKRNLALHSYIATQCKDDEEVKFKQVELQNKLLDLFVDLPVMPLDFNDTEFQRGLFSTQNYRRLVDADGEVLIERHHVFHMHPRDLPETAAFLLKDGFEIKPACLVLEGAPGQGKSTITQYVCQVHRLKLLGRAVDLTHAPKSHLDAPVRIPFRVDLRDYAAWLSGRNPFAPDGQNAEIRSSTLESFIAAQVGHLSGGQDFSAADLTAVIKNGRVLIVLDGFDEVADIPTRQRVVEEITRAASRIRAHQKQAQIVVTSRPAAFANSPGFPHSEWLHLEIQSMTPDQIDEYAKKWMSARHLQPRERKEFLSLLKEKLEQPHMRELSRNPMQLTILLALIHTRGLSLPDKRTALYDNYMELFFNRESEKSRVVREHRDLLLDIHRYLAWVLHTTAEEKGSGGIISENDLKSLLREYLQNEGHDAQLVQELFTGMVERVVALVSRAQGTFEFEVQPLREYFAARHLYETAPYSPPGDERSGTKPERFEALSRNFYWLNVVRFYCGCFSRGELSSLVDGLDELANDSDYKLLAHPRTLAFMLLGDWVFSQQPILVARVVDRIFTSPGLKILLSTTSRASASEVALPERCGRGDLVKLAFQMLSERSPNRAERDAILQLIKVNTDLAPRIQKWLSDKPGEGFDEWFADGVALGTIRSMPASDLSLIALQHPEAAGTVLRDAHRYDVIYSDERLFTQVLNNAVNGTQSFPHISGQGESKSSLETAVNLLTPFLYRFLLANTDRINVATDVLRLHGLDSQGTKEPLITDFPALRRTQEFVAEASTIFQSETSLWTSTLEPWKRLIAVVADKFGCESWAASRLAVLSGGIRSSKVVGSWGPTSWSIDEGIADRMRYARLKSGNAAWWREQILSVQGGPKEPMVALAAAAWASSKTLVTLSGEMSKLLDSLGPTEWQMVHGTLVQAFFPGKEDRSRASAISGLPADVSPRLLVVVARRDESSTVRQLVLDHLSGYAGDDPVVKSSIGNAAMLSLLEDNGCWVKLKSTLTTRACGSELFIQEQNARNLSEDIARDICSSAEEYPMSLVSLAQMRLASATGQRAAKLGNVSRSSQWF